MTPKSDYGKLNVPAFTPVDQGETQRNYFNMVNQNMGDAISATSAINQANQQQYTNALNQVFGGSYADTWKSGLDTLKARVEGKWTEEQLAMFDTQAAAKSQRLGLNAAPASINVSMQGFGSQMLRAQESAIAQMPSFMTAARQNLMATPTRVESMFIPISQYASQRSADNISVWRQQYAQAQADHQALMAAEALRRQEEQAAAAQADSIRAQGVATRNAINMQNAANYRAGVRGAVNPFTPQRGGRQYASPAAVSSPQFVSRDGRGFRARTSRAAAPAGLSDNTYENIG